MKTLSQSIRLISALALLVAAGAPTQAQSLTDSLAGSPAPVRSASAATPHHARHHKRAADADTPAATAESAQISHRRAHPNPDVTAVAPTISKSHAHAKKLKAAAARKAVRKAAAAEEAIVSAPADTMGLTIQQAASTKTIAAAPHPIVKAHAAAVSLDDMTRDGSLVKQDPSTADGASMNIGGAVLRAVLALAFVLALIVSIVYALRKKGYGVAAANGYSTPLRAAGSAPIRGSVRGAGNWKPAKESASFVAPSAARLNTMDDLEVLSHQLLPGTTSSLYKVRIGERVLLLGCSPDGVLSVLTEWDVETKPETDESFETLLNEMEAETGEYPFARSNDLNGTAERLGQTVKRLSSIGGAGKSFRKSA